MRTVIRARFFPAILLLFFVPIFLALCACGRAHAPLIPEPKAIYYYDQGRASLFPMSDSEQVQLFRAHAGRLVGSSSGDLVPVESSEADSALHSFGAVQATFGKWTPLRPEVDGDIRVLIIPFYADTQGIYYVLQDDGWYRGQGEFRLAVEGLYAQASRLGGGQGIPPNEKEPFLGF